MSAGIRQAKCLITAVTSDSANVYITLTARGLNQDLFVLAWASEEGAEIKLMRAVANKVVSPYTIGASRMAHALLRPSVVDFIEIATGDDDIQLQLEEFKVSAKSQLAGTTLLTSARSMVLLSSVSVRMGPRFFSIPALTPQLMPVTP